MRTYKSEFPDFGELDVELPQSFKDISWHNDACPCFEQVTAKEFTIRVYIDYKDLIKRESSNSDYRFSVMAVYGKEEQNAGVMLSDDWNEILEFIAQY